MIIYVVGPSVRVVATELESAGLGKIAWARFIGKGGEDLQIVTQVPFRAHREPLRLKRAASYESGEGAPNLDNWIKEMENFELLVSSGQAEWV